MTNFFLITDISHNQEIIGCIEEGAFFNERLSLAIIEHFCFEQCLNFGKKTKEGENIIIEQSFTNNNEEVEKVKVSLQMIAIY